MRGDGRVGRRGKLVEFMGMGGWEMGDSNFFRYFRGLTCTSKTMAKKSEHALIPLEVIAGKIFVLRGHRVMLDRDLAELYGAETRALNQAVKRNQARFPEDFMFRLTPEEANSVLNSRSQIVILNAGHNIKYLPYVFTEHGVVMLANVLKSAVAVRASIQVVRAFVHLRRLLATNEQFARKIEALEKKVGKHDADLQAILAMLRKILEPPPLPPRRLFGFASPTRNNMKPKLFWILGPWRGRLAVASRPRGGDWLEDEITGWRKAGLDVVVSLLEKDEAAQFELGHEGEVAESKGVRFISFPIPDRGVPASTREALSLFSRIAAALDEGKNVALHCRQGIGRSGLIAAGVLLTSGMGVDKALEVVGAARGEAIPETPAQLQWIRHLPSDKFVLTS